MKTIEIQLFKFSELSEDAQQKAVENNYDINLDYWWDFVYEDAKTIGLEITEFELDRGSYAKGKFLWSAPEVANKIVAEHGETCTTYQTARTFLIDYDALVEKYSDGITKNVVAEDNESNFDEDADDLENEFLLSLLEDYRINLSKEFDYLSGREAIQDTLILNDYDFTEDGKIY